MTPPAIRAAVAALAFVLGTAACAPAPVAVAARAIDAPAAPREAFHVATPPFRVAATGREDAAARGIAIAPGRIVDTDAPEAFGPGPAPSASPAAQPSRPR